MGLILKSRKDLPEFLINLGLINNGAEIGVCQGHFSHHILKHWPGKLYSIDSFTHWPNVYQDLSNVFPTEHLKNLRLCEERLSDFGKRSKIITKTSVEASNLFEQYQLDFVYIDAQHHYRNVFQDLVSWFDKIKNGGLLSGHDYFNKYNRKNLVEVKKAVDDFSFQYGLTVHKTTDDHLPSWYIFKNV